MLFYFIIIIILSIFACMEQVLETINRMSKEVGATGVVPLSSFCNERRRLDNEELKSLRINGVIAARKLVNGFGIELIK